MQEMLISILEDRAGILERKIHAGLQLLSAVHSAFTLHSIYTTKGLTSTTTNTLTVYAHAFLFLIFVNMTIPNPHLILFLKYSIKNNISD